MTRPIRFHCSALHLSAVVDVAIDALDASRFADAADALEVFCRRRLDGEAEPYTNADRRVRDAWGELAREAAPSDAWRLARCGL